MTRVYLKTNGFRTYCRETGVGNAFVPLFAANAQLLSRAAFVCDRCMFLTPFVPRTIRSRLSISARPIHAKAFGFRQLSSVPGSPPLCMGDPSDPPFVLSGGVEKSRADLREYRHIQLPNKLQALLVHDYKADKAAAAVDISVGHFSDPEGVPGLAHFLEHMLFMGTEKYPDENAYSAFLSDHGGSSNAYTSMESTNYHLDVTHAHLEPALDLCSTWHFTDCYSATC
jgi:hypothetical protein